MLILIRLYEPVSLKPSKISIVFANIFFLVIIFSPGSYEASEVSECESRIDALLRIMDALYVAKFSVFGKV